MEPQDALAVWTQALLRIEQHPDISPRQLAYAKLVKPLGFFDDTRVVPVATEASRDDPVTTLLP